MIIILPSLSGCGSSESMKKILTSNISAEYIQYKDSLMNSAQEYHTEENDRNGIYITNGAELILSLSNISTSGNSSDEKTELAAAVRSVLESRIILSSCNISSFGENSSTVFADNSEIIICDSTVSAEGKNSPAINAENGSSIMLDNVKIQSSQRDFIKLSDSTLDLSNSNLDNKSESYSIINQKSGKSKLESCEINSPNYPVASIDNGELVLEKGKMSYKKLFAEFSGTFNFSVFNTEFISDGEDFISIQNAPLGKILISDSDIYGIINTDGNSRVELKLKSSNFHGSINSLNKNKTINISLDEKSVWSVSAESYISSLKNEKINLSNIESNGFDVFYDLKNDANSWLDGKAHTLNGGGELKPY